MSPVEAQWQGAGYAVRGSVLGQWLAGRHLIEVSSLLSSSSWIRRSDPPIRSADPGCHCLALQVGNLEKSHRPRSVGHSYVKTRSRHQVHHVDWGSVRAEGIELADAAQPPLLLTHDDAVVGYLGGDFELAVQGFDVRRQRRDLSGSDFASFDLARAGLTEFHLGLASARSAELD
jgi:hypothetical protein